MSWLTAAIRSFTKRRRKRNRTDVLSAEILRSLAGIDIQKLSAKYPDARWGKYANLQKFVPFQVRLCAIGGLIGAAPMHILDVGCGGGIFLRCARHFGHDGIGIDVEDPFLADDPVAYERLNTSLQNLQEMTRRINAGEGSLGRLVNDDALVKSLTSATGNLDQITAGLRKGDGTAGKLLTDKELYDRFNSLAARIDTLAGNLNSGQGTVGQLIQDKQLYDNMNAAASELRALIGDIRKDPKRYLNVRVSIF